MFRRDSIQKTAILLLPLVLGFSFQWALEVFHPIEEGFSPSHQHSGSSDLVHATSAGLDGHSPHACPHSGAFAQIRPGGSTAVDHKLCMSAAVPFDTPLLRYASNVFQRGPPRT